MFANSAALALSGKQIKGQAPRDEKEIIEIKKPEMPFNNEPSSYFEFSNYETLACEMTVTGHNDDTHKLQVRMIQDGQFSILKETRIKTNDTLITIEYKYTYNPDGSLTIVPRTSCFGKTPFTDPYDEIDEYIKSLMGVAGEGYYTIDSHISPASNTFYTNTNEYGVTTTNYQAKLPNGEKLNYFLFEEPGGNFMSEWYSQTGNGQWNWIIADTTDNRRDIYQTQEPVFSDDGEFSSWNIDTYLGGHHYSTTSTSEDGTLLFEQKEEISNTGFGEHGNSTTVSYKDGYIKHVSWHPNNKSITFDFPTLGYSVYFNYFKGNMDKLCVIKGGKRVSEQTFAPSIIDRETLLEPVVDKSGVRISFQTGDKKTIVVIDEKGRVDTYTLSGAEELPVPYDIPAVYIPQEGLTLNPVKKW